MHWRRGGPANCSIPRPAPAVIEALNREVTQLVKTAEMGEKLGDRGVLVETASPQEFTDFIKSDIQKWRGVMIAAGIPQE